MNALLVTVGTGLLVTAVGWAVAYLVRAWRRFRLWRISLTARRASWTVLRACFAGTLTRRRLGSARTIPRLARSFRFEVEARGSLPSEPAHYEIGNANLFLKHLERPGGDFVHLVNAESGCGKTVLGITLTLLRWRVSREGLVPLYLDVGDADPEKPLLQLEKMLERLRGRTDLWGRPLFIFDALNETVEPEYFAEELATRRAELRALGGELLFLFSSRHHSYPARLRFALLEQGFDWIESVELLFDIGSVVDLGFLPQLSRGGGTSPGPAELVEELQAHAACSPAMSLSREDVRRYLASRDSNSSGRQGPSPADLCVAEILGEQTVPMASFEPLARVGFLLLGQEQKAATYGQIAQRTGLKRRKVEEAMVAKPGVLTSCGSEHVRIESEAAVRVLGALEVGRRLLGGASPQELRGRTIYDACAPYVPAALSWLQRNSDVTDSPPGSLDGSIRAALRGRHAPYSFYATVVRSDSGGVLGDRVESLDQALFEQLISAIDEDRLQTCRDSLVKAGAQEPEFLLDPVLDQLFEVMAAYGGRAVELLLGLMENSEPLIRSQAAYLLLGWIRGVARDPGDEERQLLELIAERMPDRDGNLHFRFHQVEILESLQGAQALSGSASHSQVVSLLREIGADPGDSSERIDGYADFQALVSLHARALAGVTPPGPATAEMRDRLQRCVSILEAGGKFWESGDKAAIEESLECWEVCLGMAVRMCGAVRRNAFFASFIEGALEHDLWIVRWWAFSGMVGLVVRAAEAEESTLARRWAVRVVQQLFDGIEPIGTKHSQCAEIKRLRDGDGAAARIVREALLAVPAPIATERGRQELGERYYEVMGSSPDAYLGEFFRRLDGLSPRRNPLSASR